MGNFKNRTIWTGDNLPILRGLNSESVDLIYLDPPFNSNQDYAAPIGSKAAGAAFKDTWTLDDVDKLWLLLLRDKNPLLFHVIEGARLVHGKGMASYLSMMAQRLLEMQRVLKPTGSIYLHCDPTASHYLKMLMDAVFGRDNFRNEITWQRTESHNTAGRYGNVSDSLLYYAKADSSTWHQLHQAYGESQLSRFRHVDKSGRRYKLDDLTAPRPDSESGKFEWRGTTPGSTRGWGYRLEQLEGWWEEGRIHTKQDGTPRMDGLKVYLDSTQGKPLQNIWIDIPRIPNTSTERVGYPTQKPLKLLDRIIQASSNEGDVVLDPFCGCATTLVAAERRGRQWMGIDLSAKAFELVEQRLQDAINELELYHKGDVIHRTDQPQRTDLGKLKHPREHKDVLYGKQSGQCGGCMVMFHKRNLTIDHIEPKNNGGTDHVENLWLLCGACNSSKGTKSQAEFLKERVKRGGSIEWLL